jgi:hypothetical protein
MCSGRRLALLALLVAGGCKTRPYGVIYPAGEGPDVDAAGIDDVGDAFPPSSKLTLATCRQDRVNEKVDLLFVVDNSGSMTAMQSELQARFPDFLAAFAGLASSGIFLDLHLGVITTDYGAGPQTTPGCDASPGGQRGELQAVGAAAQRGCLGPVGASYIAYDSHPKGKHNLPSSQTLASTFACMASVGAGGCGFEHVLESSYAALTQPIFRNAGFLRDDALLAVVYLTNEDDCSGPPDSDLFDNSLDAARRYGHWASFRCTRFGVQCGDPPVQPPYGSSSGPLMSCAPAPSPPGKLYDVQRYLDLFARPRSQGGIKASPADVVLVGIDAPSEPFSTVLSTAGPDSGGAYPECPLINEVVSPPCLPVLQHACMNPQASEFYGDPAVRLNRVIRAAANHALFSICDDNYSAALQSVARLILSHLGDCCVPETLPVDVNRPGVPDLQATSCIVEEITYNLDGTTLARAIPRCAGETPSTPCWRIEVVGACASGSPQSFGVVVDRGGAIAPSYTIAHATCVTM